MCYTYFLNMEKQYKVLSDLIADCSIVSYSGTFTGALLEAFVKQLDYKFGTDTKLDRKIFKIFVELAQNISMYSCDRVPAPKNQAEFTGSGIIIIKEYDDCFNLYAGNLAKTKDISIIQNKCKKINSLSRDELRAYKRELRRSPSMQGGGNIGLVQVVLTAENYINFEVKEIDNEHSFIIFNIEIFK